MAGYEFRGKRAWMRIVEAFIAVLIIVSVLVFSVAKFDHGSRAEEIQKMQRGILEQIALNDELREEILYYSSTKDLSKTEAFVRQGAPAYWEYSIKVCEIENICGMDVYVGEIGKEVYSDEILISSNIHIYNPQKLKLFVWEK